MPVERCSKDGKPGYRWGKQGTCYTYTSGDKASRERAKAKATKQGRAIEVNKQEDIMKRPEFRRMWKQYRKDHRYNKKMSFQDYMKQFHHIELPGKTSQQIIRLSG